MTDSRRPDGDSFAFDDIDSRDASTNETSRRSSSNEFEEEDEIEIVDENDGGDPSGLPRANRSNVPLPENREFPRRPVQNPPPNDFDHIGVLIQDEMKIFPAGVVYKLRKNGALNDDSVVWLNDRRRRLGQVWDQIRTRVEGRGASDDLPPGAFKRAGLLIDNEMKYFTPHELYELVKRGFVRSATPVYLNDVQYAGRDFWDQLNQTPIPPYFVVPQRTQSPVLLEVFIGFIVAVVVIAVLVLTLGREKKESPTTTTPPAAVEPEKTEPEKTEPEKTEPEKTEPEKTEPEKTEPEKAEPEKAEPEKAEPEVSDSAVASQWLDAPFDVNRTSLPTDFRGHSFFAVRDALLRPEFQLPKRGANESDFDYNARVGAAEFRAEKTPLFGTVKTDSKLAFMLPNLEMVRRDPDRYRGMEYITAEKYETATQTLTVMKSFGGFSVSFFDGLHIAPFLLSRGSYGLALESPFEFGFKWANTDSYHWKIKGLPAKRYESMRDTICLLCILTVDYQGLGDTGLLGASGNYALYSREVEFWLYDSATGEILGKFSFDDTLEETPHEYRFGRVSPGSAARTIDRRSR